MQIENVSKSFGDLVLIARNGKGKSTLLKIIAGEEPLDDGKITLRSGVRVGYLEQEPDFDPALTVIEACLQRNSEKAGVIALENIVIPAPRQQEQGGVAQAFL